MKLPFVKMKREYRWFSVCAHWGSTSIYLLCKVENICRYPWQWEIYCSTRKWLKNVSCRELNWRADSQIT